MKTDFYWVKILYSRKTILIRCFYKILPLSLKKIGEIENTEKNFFPYKFVNEKTLDYVGPPPEKIFWETNAFLIFNGVFCLKDEIINYCLKNIKFILVILQKLSKIFLAECGDILKKNFSTPSISHYAFFKVYNSKSVPQFLSKKNDLYVRNAFFGGRSEVFGNPYTWENVKYYDFSGMYGQVMRECFHNGEGVYSVPTDFYSPGFYTVTFCSKNMQIPILPRHSETGKLLFANGAGIGTYWFEELQYFLQQGGEIKKIHHAFIYPKFEIIFANFVDNFSNLRKRKGVYDIFGKLVINSFYGSTALKDDNTTIFISYSEEEVESLIKNLNIVKYLRVNNAMLLIIELDQKYKNFFGYLSSNNAKRNISIATAITSKARIKLHKFFTEIEKDGGRLLYCDTDSAFAGYSKLNLSLLINNKEWLNVYERCVFAAPKSYALLDKVQGLTIRIKGVQSDKINFEEFENAFYTSSRLAVNEVGYTSKHDFILEKKTETRVLDFSSYDKRVFSPDKKKTSPLIINTPL